MTEAIKSTNLSEQIEFLRDEMHRAADFYGIGHPAVLEISHRLDEILNYYYRTQRQEQVLIQAS